jgi:hypothetical protein
LTKVSNSHTWKPYESVHNWFSGLKYASKHLTQQATDLLDSSKVYVQKLSTIHHTLKYDFPREEIEDWAGPDPIFPVSEFASELLSILYKLKIKSYKVNRELIKRKELLDYTLG